MSTPLDEDGDVAQEYDRLPDSFRRTRHGIELRLPQWEGSVLIELVRQMDRMLEPPPVDDPLEALVGLRDTAPPPPEDPALARLLPDPYPEDPMASGDFRRRRTDDALAHKRAAARRVLATVPGPGEVLLLDEEVAQDWLTTLNDLRLVFGTRLGITDDDYLDELGTLPPDDRRLPVIEMYELLTILVDNLIRTLD
ncbi:DUF2017 domain-containing protein [Pseudofrankia sp. DC12]|uniref:DUF2017 domain-containing protein n=1 Tax=Pseudofrankia sp. DC12 TaxID=683315 RepID=UPI0005F78FEF|nr:DUF2017 domain-containing protein [Pseudofrankia sp. DC12]